jgi:hypothetical protein
MQIRIHSEVELIVISHNYVKTVIFFSKRFVDLHLLFLCIFTTIQTFCLQFYYTEQSTVNEIQESHLENKPFFAFNMMICLFVTEEILYSITAVFDQGS